MSTSVKRLNFHDVIVISPLKHNDKRGCFFENYNFNTFKEETGISFNVVQENISFSKRNVLRGLHFQKGKYAQAKLISVIRGKILDIVVDIRPKSLNFGNWISYILDDIQNESIFVPAGFAHGFLALDNNTKISYKVDKTYKKDSECSIIWNDVYLNIDWACKKPILSEKDRKSITFKENYRLNNF